MRGYNTITLSGTIIRDTDMRYTASNRAILNFEIGGVQRVGERELPFYQRCTVFGKFAESPGEQLVVDVAVMITGRLNYRSWQDQEGQNRTSIDVVVDRLFVIPALEVTYDKRDQPRLIGALNEATLGGNLGDDGELRYTPQGSAIGRFGMGVNETFRNAAGESTSTGWFNVEAWDALGERIAEFKKGESVVVRGRLKNDSYTDKEGKAQYRTVIEAFGADQVIMPGTPHPQGRGAGGHPTCKAGHPTRKAEPRGAVPPRK